MKDNNNYPVSQTRLQANADRCQIFAKTTKRKFGYMLFSLYICLVKAIAMNITVIIIALLVLVLKTAGVGR